ncbi:MAG: HAD-IA family hydrolase [Pseudanabaenaceae cyanobacterium bins.39]|nr:HAD-IA family hydrolase [Pseudanabaenaceae cyanobacterium bins.39]
MTRSPQVIFLDAVGTLFGVKDSVGAQYALVASEFGVNIDPQAINHAFYQSFKNAPRIAFPHLSALEIPMAEYQWWYKLAIQTFEQTGDFARFADFEKFFEVLYAYFASDAPWFIYPDTPKMLSYWQNQGLTLSLLSNFDSRIYPVMKALGLLDYFAAITISTQSGAAKPDPLIFQTALAKHHLERSPELAWHIGDSFSEDYCGAEAVGIQAFWLNRDEQKATKAPPQQTICTLTDLLPTN